MNKELFEALESLCYMWNQYCKDEWGHMFMTAGESCMDVLEKYQLLKNATVCSGEVDFEKLEEYRNSFI